MALASHPECYQNRKGTRGAFPGWGFISCKDYYTFPEEGIQGGQRALPKEERKRQGSLHDRRSKTNAARLTARIMKRDLEQLGKLQSLKEKAIYLLEPQDLTKIASQQKEMPWERESFE